MSGPNDAYDKAMDDSWEAVEGIPSTKDWEEVPRDHDAEERLAYEEELDRHLDEPR